MTIPEYTALVVVGVVAVILVVLGLWATGNSLPFSLVLGAIFMVIVDTLCRSISSAEIPVSIVTGLIGAPFYFYLLYRQRMSMR